MCEGAAGIGSVGDGIGEGAHSLSWTLHCNVCGSDLFDNQEHLAFCVTASFVCALSPGVRELYELYELYLLLYVSNVRACCQSSHASNIYIIYISHAYTDIFIHVYIHIHTYVYICSCLYRHPYVYVCIHV